MGSEGTARIEDVCEETVMALVDRGYLAPTPGEEGVYRPTAMGRAWARRVIEQSSEGEE